MRSWENFFLNSSVVERAWWTGLLSRAADNASQAPGTIDAS
jgi:hypothetical protein